MLGRRPRTIGLTLDRTGIRFVRLKKKKGWEIDAVHALPLLPELFADDQPADPEQLRERLSRWVQEERLKGASVTLAIPASQVIIRRLRIQTTNAKALSGLVALEVETTLHLPFEDPVHDYVKLGEDEESTQVLVFAVSRLAVRQYVDLIESAGLRVNAVELSATALARAIREQSDEAFSETMLINLDDSALEIYMFHDGYPVFSRTIVRYGPQTEQDEPLPASQLAEVTSEIARMLNFYQFSIHEGQTRITEAILVGADAGREQLLAELRQTQPEMNIKSVSFDAYAPRLGDADGDANRVAIGLALWPTAKQRIDLLPKVDREAKLLPALLSGALLLWLLALAGVVYFYVDGRSTLAMDRQTVSQLQDQITLLQNNLSARSAQAGQLNPVEAIDGIRAHRRDAVAAMDELKAKLPQGAILQSVSYSSGSQMGITVRFRELDQASRYLFDLRRMTFAAGAQLQSIVQNGASGSDETAADKTKTATYTIRFKGAEGGESGDGNDGGADR
ncbi:pilus assembly protein PilM [Cohnella sp. REN36]|uniref:pilus assembly protein PilM n=1 Tax=Cohnella sp. REN36 TaxID=2887347 RepID=UPI001D138349|nr:pilus assembly protein PilM [Cohnella sp. REN36]MCC3374611.1 pilus assembly protein PilM [Cohnella sp. REN36]